MIDLIALPTRKLGAIWILGALVAGALLVLTGIWQLQLAGGVLMLAGLVSPLVYGGLQEPMVSERPSNSPRLVTIKPNGDLDQVNRSTATVRAPHGLEYDPEELLETLEKDGYRFLRIVDDSKITPIPRRESPIEEAR